MAVRESLLAELMQLSPAERVRIADELWNSVAPSPEGTEELAPEQIAELDRRVAEHDRDPSTARPWHEVRARLWARLR